MNPALPAATHRAWLRLARAEGVGPLGFASLITRFLTPEAALAALPALARARGRAVVLPPEEGIAAEIEKASRLGIRFVCACEPDYPANLREIPGYPPVLGVLGRAECLARPAFAIVGARNASAIGRRMARMLAIGLGEGGYVVTSGLARGIDTDAHEAALPTGTVAVLAGGLDQPYPPENAELMQKIAQNGAVVSEMPLGLAPRGRDFPRRNRLISGLSRGVVVVEAARRSGSLITARKANEQGREVFAVPGSPLDPRCEGTNDLLREGALLATSAEDILAVLRPLAGDLLEPLHRPHAPRRRGGFSEEGEGEPFAEWEDDSAAGQISGGSGSALQGLDGPQSRQNTAGEDLDLLTPPTTTGDALLDLISFVPVEIDILTRLSGLATRKVQTRLIELELEGKITRLPGNCVARSL